MTFAQACRLWHADEAKCLAALEALIDEGFLRRSPSGAFINLPRPQGKVMKVLLADTPPAVRCPHCHHLNVVSAERRVMTARASTPFRCVACWRVVTVAHTSAQG